MKDLPIPLQEQYQTNILNIANLDVRLTDQVQYTEDQINKNPLLQVKMHVNPKEPFVFTGNGHCSLLNFSDAGNDINFLVPFAYLWGMYEKLADFASDPVNDDKDFWSFKDLYNAFLAANPTEEARALSFDDFAKLYKNVKITEIYGDYKDINHALYDYKHDAEQLLNMAPFDIDTLKAEIDGLQDFFSSLQTFNWSLQTDLNFTFQRTNDKPSVKSKLNFYLSAYNQELNEKDWGAKLEIDLDSYFMFLPLKDDFLTYLQTEYKKYQPHLVLSSSDNYINNLDIASFLRGFLPQVSEYNAPTTPLTFTCNDMQSIQQPTLFISNNNQKIIKY